MDQNLSNVLDDRDEFVLDDKDEFHQDIQRLFFRSNEMAQRGAAHLAKLGYNVVISCIEDQLYVVEGGR